MVYEWESKEIITHGDAIGIAKGILDRGDKQERREFKNHLKVALGYDDNEIKWTLQMGVY